MRTVLQEGISACLKYLDWFPTASQRQALTIVANCCAHIPQSDFHLIEEDNNLSLLASMLTHHVCSLPLLPLTCPLLAALDNINYTKHSYSSQYSS